MPSPHEFAAKKMVIQDRGFVRDGREIAKRYGVTQDLSGDPNDRELEQGGVSTPLVERLRTFG